jgi:hypothetical protein
VDKQAEPAVGKLTSERRGVGVAEPQFGIVQLPGVRWHIQPDLDAVDAAALDALVQVRSAVQGVANDEKVAVGVQLLARSWRLEANDERVLYGAAAAGHGGGLWWRR